eukprot:6193062-Pleurochrysis_carterae.AAC.1
MPQPRIEAAQLTYNDKNIVKVIDSCSCTLDRPCCACQHSRGFSGHSSNVNGVEKYPFELV